MIVVHAVHNYVILEGTEQGDSLGYSHKETYTRAKSVAIALWL
jgi:hypothetical protein